MNSMPTKVDGIIRCTLAHEDLRFFSDDYDAQIPGFRGYLGDPLQLCRVWTWSRLVQTFKSMKDFPRVLGIPQIPRKKDGPWDTKHGLNWNAPPICGWYAEGVRPNGDGPPARYALEAIRVAESCRGGLKRGGGGGAPSFPHLHSPSSDSFPLPLFQFPPPRIFARPVSFQRIDYDHVPLPGFKFGREVPLVGSLPRGWDNWDFASLCEVSAAVSFWECESLPGTPTEVSPRTGGDDWVGQKKLWARGRHCEILEPDQRSGPDYYCHTSRGSTA